MAGNTSRRGRPVGSLNAEYLDAVAIPAVCPRCGSADIVAVKGAPPIIRLMEGTLATGQPYAKVEWQRSRCECGQHVTVRKYFPKK
jgi:hypothetical protein